MHGGVPRASQFEAAATPARVALGQRLGGSGCGEASGGDDQGEMDPATMVNRSAGACEPPGALSEEVPCEVALLRTGS